MSEMTVSTYDTVPLSVREAFAYCRQVARDHYENFPVASLLLPRRIRPFVYSIYAFARAADDFADEGTAPPEERLRRLDAWEDSLNQSFAGEPPNDPVFIALAETGRQTGIPRQLLANLLRAFRMDVQVSRFQRFDDLLHYCTFSANPVGRLILCLFEKNSPENLAFSDNVCTALQLANFWQDVGVDWSRGRLYIPLEDMDRFRYTESDLARGIVDARFCSLMREEIARTRAFFDAGAPLIHHTGRRLGFELSLTLAGGRAILDAVERQKYDTLTKRPALSTSDKVMLFLKALSGRRL